MSQYSTIIRIMIEAARKAGKVLLRDFGEVENLQVSQKGPADFVTASDLRSEKILVKELQHARPDYGFLLEESGEIKGKSDEFRWIIDPIDGTSNFMHGMPYFSISIALERRSGTKPEIIAGVIYAPVLDELFWAERGFGAYGNNRRLIVSARKKMSESVAATGIFKRGSEEEYKRQLKIIESLTDESCAIRALGSAALELAYVAAGRLEAFWHPCIKPWDIAAGMLMVREAKGLVSDFSGGQTMMESGIILATNDSLHRTFQTVLSSYT